MQPLCLTSRGCKKGSAAVELGALRQSTLTCTTIKTRGIAVPQSLILYCIILILFFKAVILWLIYVLFIKGK